MFADIEKTCAECGTTFWWTAEEQEYLEELGVSAAAVRCPDCRRKKTRKKTRRRSKKKSTALVPVAPPQVPDLVSQTPPDQAGFIEELQYWVNEAHAVYPLREQTLWERIKGCNDNWWEEEQRRASALATAQGLISEQQMMFDSVSELETARAHTEAAIVIARTDAETAVVRSRTELLEAKLEQLELQEQFRRKLIPQAAAKEHSAPHTLEDVTSMKDDLEARQAQDRYRRKLRERAMADQTAISEFLDQVRRVFNHPTFERTERAARIRSLMDSFSKGLEDLPAEIRRFMNRVETEGDD